MYNKGKRKNIFVCSAINNTDLISKEISADSIDEASSFFESEFNFKPKIILGPFNKKRVIENNLKTINFSKPSRKAIYNEWFVNAFEIKETDREVFIIYLNPVSNNKKQRLNNTCIVPISDLVYT